MSMRSKQNRRVSLRKQRLFAGGVTVAVYAPVFIANVAGGIVVVAFAVGDAISTV
jgi:hypothetical protein